MCVRSVLFNVCGLLVHVTLCCWCVLVLGASLAVSLNC